MTAETIHTHERVTVLINQKPYHFGVDQATGRQLKAAAAIPDANLLFLEEPGTGDDVPIRDDQVVALKSGQHFYDMPPGNFGSHA